MARVYKKNNSLKDKIDKKIPIYLVLLIIVTLSFSLSIFYTEIPLFLFTPLLWFWGLLRIRKISSRNKRYKAGLTGEENVLRILKKLNNKYYIFTDINLPRREGINSAQIDTIVLSNRGITIVEVKNIKGLAVGNIKDEYIDIIKYKKNGDTYSKEIYNPYKQVKGHAYKLSKYLNHYGIDIFIEGIVFFNQVEEGVKPFKIKGSKKKIFYKERKLLKRIKGNKNFIDRDNLEKIIEILEEISE